MIIKSCPFCKNNEQVIIKNVHGNPFVKCNYCKATGPLTHTFEESVSAWNEGDKTTTPIDFDMGRRA